MVRHGVSAGDCLVLTVLAHLLLTAYVLGVVLAHYEVGCEHGCGNFAAVVAIADERVHQSGRSCGKLQLNSTTKASCRGGIIIGTSEGSLGR